MKPEFIPGKGATLSESLKNNEGRVGFPESFEDEAFDTPYVVVKLEEPSETESDIDLFAPIEFSEGEDDDKEEHQQPTFDYDTDSSGVATEQKHNITTPKNENDKDGQYYDKGDISHRPPAPRSPQPQKNPARSQTQKNTHMKGILDEAGIPKSGPKRQPKKATNVSPKQKSPKRSVSTSNSNGKGKPQGRKKKSLSEMLPFGLTQSEPRNGVPGGRIAAPYTKPEPGKAISPQTAMEPPAFPTTQAPEKAQCCEKQEGVLLEVLNHCRFLYTAFHRLEQKIDNLQSSRSNSHGYPNHEIPKEFMYSAVQKLEQRIDSIQSNPYNARSSVSLNNAPEAWYSAIQRLEDKIEGLQSNSSSLSHRLPKEDLLQDQTSLPFGTDQPPWSMAQGNGSPGQRDPDWRQQTSQRGPGTPPTPPQPATSRKAGKPPPQPATGRKTDKPPGEGRGKGKQRGRPAAKPKGPSQKEPPVRASQPKRSLSASVTTAEEGRRPSKVLKSAQEQKKVVSTASGKKGRPSKTVSVKQEATPPAGDDKKVLIGSPGRKVWVPVSVYMQAFKEAEPQKAIVPVLQAVFTPAVLSCSGVIADPSRGILQLDPNKLEAIREWLAEMYPQHDIGVRGVAWALCLGVIQRVTKELRNKRQADGPEEKVSSKSQ